MVRKGTRTPWPQLGAPEDAQGLTRLAEHYLTMLQVRGCTEATLRSRRSQLTPFLQWCELRNLQRADVITKPMLERYQRYLFYYRRKNGKPLTVGAQVNRLRAVRTLFRWLVRSGYLVTNPASDLEMPRMPQRLPKAVLSADEAEKVLALPDVSTPMGLRDRAMLETLYSTGIRRAELGHLKVWDVDAERGTLTVREGKGRKDRMVPAGARALSWIARYVSEARPQLVTCRDDGTLFVNQLGEPFDLVYLSHRVRHYVDAAKLGKSGACHLFRHTMATAMLENGADIRHIQAMLGHASISTTQIYTRVSMRLLKEIHAATHPASLASADESSS